MPDEPPETLTTEQVKASVPDLAPRAELVLIGDRIYKRDGREWCLLMTAVELDVGNHITEVGS